MTMQAFRHACLQVGTLLALAAAGRLVGPWALALGALVLVMAALTAVIEREARAQAAEDTPELHLAPEPDGTQDPPEERRSA